LSSLLTTAGVMAFSGGPTVFAVFAGNYQRQIALSPQESSISDGILTERTARCSVVGGYGLRSPASGVLGA